MPQYTLMRRTALCAIAHVRWEAQCVTSYVCCTPLRSMLVTLAAFLSPFSFLSCSSPSSPCRNLFLCSFSSCDVYPPCNRFRVQLSCSQAIGFSGLPPPQYDSTMDGPEGGVHLIAAQILNCNQQACHQKSKAPAPTPRPLVLNACMPLASSSDATFGAQQASGSALHAKDALVGCGGGWVFVRACVRACGLCVCVCVCVCGVFVCVRACVRARAG